MVLRDELWAEIKAIYDAVVAHQFVIGLTDGSLPAEALRYFMAQDIFHLRNYARALTTCAAKAPAEHDAALLANYAIGAITAAEKAQAGFSKMFGNPVPAGTASVGPTTQAYGSFLVATCSNGSFAEALGALLPCYWFYPAVAEELLRRSTPESAYRRWIEAYHPGEKYEELLGALLALIDRVGETISPGEKARMVEHAVTASRYEWMFGDAAWRRLAWPI